MYFLELITCFPKQILARAARRRSFLWTLLLAFPNQFWRAQRAEENPFGPYKLPTNKEEKDMALKEIGDEVMCRIAALLPEESHGEFKGSPKIKEFRIQNDLAS